MVLDWGKSFKRYSYLIYQQAYEVGTLTLIFKDEKN